MSKAQELKALVAYFSSATFRHGFEYSKANCESSKVTKEKADSSQLEKALHAAIDAQQSIIDEQRAEIERLRGLIKGGLDVCDPRCDGDVEWMDAAIAAIAAGSPSELTPADVCGKT